MHAVYLQDSICSVEMVIISPPNCFGTFPVSTDLIKTIPTGDAFFPPTPHGAFAFPLPPQYFLVIGWTLVIFYMDRLTA